MTRIAKLYDQLVLNRKQLSFAEFQRLIEAFGYRLDRIKGSHHTYRHPGIGQRMQIQPNGKEAKDYQVEQFLAIVRHRGLSLDKDK
jgi:predicted RNA binding protein YcfA (HicA-like mRNA interferase family)